VAVAIVAALLVPAAAGSGQNKTLTPTRLVSDGVGLPGQDSSPTSPTDSASPTSPASPTDSASPASPTSPASPADPREPCPEAATPEQVAPRNRPISFTVPDKVTPVEVPSGYPVFGIDVSNHQGWIDWSWVASSGAKFAYAKATEGTGYLDPHFNYNYHAAKRNGLYAGAYHFARPDVSGGRAQANYFLDRAQFANDGRTLPPMLDIEWPWTGSRAPFPCYGLSRWQLGKWISDSHTRVRERTGRPTMIYTNINWWNPCVGYNTSFGRHPLFIARYAGGPGSLLAGWRDWTIWQYSSAGWLPGDQDVFNGNLAALKRLARG
jgi:GH25 family lysozyme M1 (1,4-beta-N-acetylmuramidase)